VLDLVPTTAHHTGKVGEATIHIMEAKEMWASALAALEKEPLCLVNEVVPGSENHSLVAGSSVSRTRYPFCRASLFVANVHCAEASSSFVAQA
jgi:hypothetical protein